MTAPSAIGALVAAVLMGPQDPADRGDPQQWVTQLSAADPLVVEEARRRLCLAVAAADLPAAALTQLVREGSAVAATAAGAVLQHHGRLPTAWLARAEPELRRLALPLAEVTALRAMAGDSAAVLRRAALFELEDRGTLRDAELVRAIDDLDPAVGEAAVRLLLYERAPLPDPAVLNRLTPRGRKRLLLGLRERPRRGAAPWLRALLESDELAPRERLLAIAGLPAGAAGVDLGREVVRAAGTAELAAAASLAALRFASATADRLVGAAHAEIRDGAPVADVLACLEACSPRGEQQILALSEVLSPRDVETVCSWLTARGAPGLVERIESALAGEVEMASHLLRRSAAHLDRPERVQRVAALLLAADERSVLAFYALAEAGVWAPAMHDFMQGADAKKRVRALLRTAAPSAVPADALRRLLAHPQAEVAVEVCRAVQRRPALIAGLEDDLVAMVEAGGPLLAPAAYAVTAGGSRAAVTQAWRQGEAGLRRDLVRALVRHARPFAGPLLREFAEAPNEPVVAHELQWALVALGDAAAIQRLFGDAGALPHELLRRCGAAARAALRAEHLPGLTAALLGPDAVDAARRLELVEWLAARPRLAGVPALLERVERDDPSVEVQTAARAGLLRGPAAAARWAQLRAAWQQPLDANTRELAFDLLGAVAPPLDAAQQQAIAELVLVAPLAAPVPSAAPDVLPRNANYPLHLPVVEVLRRDEDLEGTVFGRVARDLSTHRWRHRLSGRRVGHLLTELVRFPRPRATLAPSLARLVLQAPDVDRPYAGVAHLVLAEAAERAGDDPAAATHYSVAGRALLRDPLPALLQRAVLGGVAAEAHALGETALAARMRLSRARAAAVRGDGEAARREIEVAAELAADVPALRDEIAAWIEEWQR